MEQKLIALFLIVVMVASAVTAVGLVTTTTKVDALTATTTKITPSKTHPAVGESVTFTATLKAGTTGLSKTVTIWHYRNGVRYSDGTHNTVNGVYKFTQAFGSVGPRLYYAKFHGDSKYAVSSSSVTVYVGTKTTTTITTSNKYPVVNEWFMLTVTLKAGTTGLSKPVKIWLTEPNGKDYIIDDGTHPTNAQGVLLFSQNWFTKGKYVYHVQFAGDSKYASSASAVTVYVEPKTAHLSLHSTNYNPNSGEIYTLWGNLVDSNLPAPNNGLDNKRVDIWFRYAGEAVGHKFTSVQTNELGFYAVETATVRTTYWWAVFAGDTSYRGSTSNVLTITIH